MTSARGKGRENEVYPGNIILPGYFNVDPGFSLERFDVGKSFLFGGGGGGGGGRRILGRCEGEKVSIFFIFSRSQSDFPFFSFGIGL